MRYLKRYEKLDPGTYYSAASQLKTMGHIERPKDLTEWGDKMSVKKIEDIFKMGEYSIDLYHGGHKQITGKFKMSLEIKFDRSFDVAYNNWMNQESGDEIWLKFKVIVIPMDDETINNLQKLYPNESRFLFSSIDGPSKVKEYTLNSYLNINLSYSRDIIDKDTFIVKRDGRSSCKYYYTNSSKVKKQISLYNADSGEFVPSGDIIFTREDDWSCPRFSRINDSYPDNTILFSDRKSALKFKNDLRSIFRGDIIVGKKSGNPGGIKEVIMDELCSEREITFDEFERFISSIDTSSINNIYKD